MLYAPIEALTQTAWALEGAAAGAQRCFEVLDHADDVRDAPDAAVLTGTRGAIRFENVDFGYDPAQPILQRHRSRRSAGPARRLRRRHRGGQEHAAIARAAILRSDGGPRPARRARPARRSPRNRSARRSASCCRTRCFFPPRSARTSPTDGRTRRKRRSSRPPSAHRPTSSSASLPQGYDSPVGERGGHLSVGQRQRIGIARAFLKNSPILLLDEPTSALDPATERAIMDTLEELMRGRTTLIITHRLTTVHHLDQIVVLEKAASCEIGTGDELLARPVEVMPDSSMLVDMTRRRRSLVRSSSASIFSA